METTDYEDKAMRTMNTALNRDQLLVNAALGLAGEAGEVADMIKKCNFQGHDLDVTNVKKELGDILWYIALACRALDTSFAEVMQQNIDKLKARYPNGFDADKSVNRKD